MESASRNVRRVGGWRVAELGISVTASWLLRRGGNDGGRYGEVERSTEEKKKLTKKHKANDRSRRGLPRVFANSERGLDTATALSRNGSMTDLEMV